VFERFTDRARRVLVLAQEEARLLNHSFIGTEHILLGLIGEGDGVAAQALAALRITPEAVRERVRETIGMAGTSPSGSPPFTPRAKKVLELSLREALQQGHSYIGTEHILLGLVREGEGVAATVLVSLGADLGRVRQQVMSLVSGHGHPEDVGATLEEPIAYPSVRARVVPETSPEPRCPQCDAGLGEKARFRTISVAAEDPDSAKEAITLDVVYCGQCGMTLHMFTA
jgi:ATP-dependent Clp protease ATP-binding subunit ClpC